MPISLKLRVTACHGLPQYRPQPLVTNSDDHASTKKRGPKNCGRGIAAFDPDRTNCGYLFLPQQSLYILPEPQGHGAFGFGFAIESPPVALMPTSWCLADARA